MHLWEPDPIVSQKVISGAESYHTLSEDNRRWVVADLTMSGYTADMIADWLGCSSRQIKRLRAELATRVMGSLIETRQALGESEQRERRARSEIRTLKANHAQESTYPRQALPPVVQHRSR